MKYIVIGLADNPQQEFSGQACAAIAQGKVFSGGRRHHDLVAHLLPDDAEWIDITVPMERVFESYNEQCVHAGTDVVVVFASNDPLFYGFANTIRRFQPKADIVLFPYFNSLQLLAHRLVMPYHDMRVVSLTGRPWHEFDRALIERSPKMGVLTDREHTPATIAARMLEFGFAGYTMTVGEHLGSPEQERIRTFALEEAANLSFDYPNCILLQTTPARLPLREFGLDERCFALLDGRSKMITKMPIRLLALQALHLYRHHVLWDIGFCTGSVSIEAKLQFPHLRVVAFEVREVCKSILLENMHRFHCPGIQAVMGDFMEADLQALPAPDAVFIGGHGGKLKEFLYSLNALLPVGAHVVLNSVTSQSTQLFEEAVQELGFHAQEPHHVTLDNNNPITILSAIK